MIDLVDLNYGTKIKDLDPGETFCYSGDEHPHGYYLLGDFESSNGKLLGIELRTGVTRGFKKDISVEVEDFVMIPKQKYMKDKTREITERKKEEAEDQGQEKVQNKEKPREYETKKEKRMLLDFLRKTVELRRFPKTAELDEDPEMEDYRVYYNKLGSKSNICDMILSEIKRDTIDKEFMEVLKKYCEYCEAELSECGKRIVDCLMEEVKENKTRNWNYDY